MESTQLSERRIHDLDVYQSKLIILQLTANTKHLYIVRTMLNQRQRRWADVVQMLYKCFVFAGVIAMWSMARSIVNHHNFMVLFFFRYEIMTIIEITQRLC